MRIAFINSNRMQPAISPIGLEYVADAVHRQGHKVDLLDLCWEEDLAEAVRSFFSDKNIDLVALTLRNTDDCSFVQPQEFITPFAALTQIVKNNTDALLVAGGAGFSTLAVKIIPWTKLDFGLLGEGENAMLALLHSLEHQQDVTHVPGLIWKKNQSWWCNPPVWDEHLEQRAAHQREWLDHRRYFRVGGQGNVETKRGCPRQCIYCADPVAKGRKIRLRSAKAVVDELAQLLEMGVNHIHFCDSEFNFPADHAMSVCEEITQRGLADRLQWYAYCSPFPFSKALAEKMARSGCVGINFGVDSGDRTILKRLQRDHEPEQILQIAQICRQAGIATMFDLLLGTPGETLASVQETIQVMKKAGPDYVGISTGVRIYPGTTMSHMALDPAGLTGGEGIQPLFYLEPGISQSIFYTLDRLIENDTRFFFHDPTKTDKNYNYNANDQLVQAIAQGHRGAYWHILGKLLGSSTPANASSA
jgi:radical SAM superfamily enzyme YgiQ (UPF0313 family)